MNSKKLEAFVNYFSAWLWVVSGTAAVLGPTIYLIQAYIETGATPNLIMWVAGTGVFSIGLFVLFLFAMALVEDYYERKVMRA